MQRRRLEGSETVMMGRRMAVADKGGDWRFRVPSAVVVTEVALGLPFLETVNFIVSLDSLCSLSPQLLPKALEILQIGVMAISKLEL